VVACGIKSRLACGDCHARLACRTPLALGCPRCRPAAMDTAVREVRPLVWDGDAIRLRYLRDGIDRDQAESDAERVTGVDVDDFLRALNGSCPSRRAAGVAGSRQGRRLNR
jgi:hypothetical protein